MIVEVVRGGDDHPDGGYLERQLGAEQDPPGQNPEQ